MLVYLLYTEDNTPREQERKARETSLLFPMGARQDDEPHGHGKMRDQCPGPRLARGRAEVVLPALLPVAGLAAGLVLRGRLELVHLLVVLLLLVPRHVRGVGRHVAGVLAREAAVLVAHLALVVVVDVVHRRRSGALHRGRHAGTSDSEHGAS